MKMKKLFILLFLLYSLICIQCSVTTATGSSEAFHTIKRAGKLSTTRFEAIYQFGDSLSDTGNLIRIPGSHDPSANLPYGQTFGSPTGRSSDGLLMVDYFAKYFHLPLVNPFLANGSNFNHGANFAVAGGTALDATTLATRNITLRLANVSLVSQLSWFKSHLHNICCNPAECKEKLRKSLVLVGEIGANDYNYALSQGRTMKEAYKLVPEVVNTIIDVVREVIKIGAVNVVVPGNVAIGCVTSLLYRYGSNDSLKYDDLHCLKEHNTLSRFHNHHLIQAIKILKRENPSVAIAYGDYYSATTWLLRHASSLGFEKDGLYKACCGIGSSYNFDPSRPCGSRGVTVCTNPNRRVSWDGTHLTQQSYKYMANWLLGQFLPKL
ncbi:acetylajmalan esterase-like [Chenopodium quinoa]|nr:acetylajmalan esterase-like [Chenopodium quinoa]